MNKGITRVALKKFRGATTHTTLEFHPDKPLVLIFGENGTGKSSLIDAIDFVCNKSAGSIDDRSSTDAKKHLPAIGCKVKEIEVELACGGDTWVAQHNGKEIVVNGPSPSPPAFILRRSRLLRLVEAEPSKRYDELRSFIDVGGVEASEQSLRVAMNESNSRLNTLSQQKVEADAALKQLWLAEREPDFTSASELDWAREKASINTAHLQTELREIDDLLTYFERAATQQNNAATAERNSEAPRKNLAELQAEAEAGVPNGAAINLKLADLLRRADEYLASQQEVKECPVCNSAVELAKLRAEIAARIADLRQPDDLNKRLSAARTACQNAEAVADNAKKQFAAAARPLALALQSSKLQLVSEAEINWEEYAQLLKAPADAATSQVQQAEVLLAVQQAEQLLAKLDVLRQRLAHCQSQLRKDLAQHNAIKQAYERALETEASSREEEIVLQRLKLALQLVHDTRIAFTQRVLDEVKEECRRLYSRIHPDEPYELSQLKLDEKRKGSLHQMASFEGFADVVPQAYFSESHLDTLGFCFWLAVSKLSSNGEAIIVIDDVFTSADNVHLSRIADLLVEECDKFRQVIITSHNRRWQTLYDYRRLPENKTCFVQLLLWRRHGGIRHHEAKLMIGELRDLLKAPILDRQSVPGKAGVLLEGLFEYLTIQYRCSMQRALQYTLRDYCNGVKKLAPKLKIYRQATNGNDGQAQEYLTVQQLIQEISDNYCVRNLLGGHANPAGEEIPDHDARRFGELTLQLIETLACPACGEIARKRNGDHFTCGCRTIRMEPVELR